MRFLFRWAFRLFLVLVVLIVALVLLKDSLLKSYAEARIQARTGLETRIGRLHSGLFSPTLTIEQLKVYNHAQFGGSPLLHVPELHVEWRLPPLALRRLHFRLVRLEVSEINVVQNKTGNTNVTTFITEFEKLCATNAPPAEVFGFAFSGIDMLNLSLGKVKHFNLKHPDQTSEVDLNLKNEIISEVKTPAQLNDAVLTALLKKGVRISNRRLPK